MHRERQGQHAHGLFDIWCLVGFVLCVQMMQQPGMRQMMASMMSNPGFVDQMLNMNPALRQVGHAWQQQLLHLQ